MSRSSIARPATLGLILMLAGCAWLAPPPVVRGNHPQADQLQELVPGTSTKQDVTALIGVAYGACDVRRQHLAVYRRDGPRSGLARFRRWSARRSWSSRSTTPACWQHIDVKDKQDALPVSVIARTTPSPGTEANFFQELFGNIGKFVPGTGPSAGVSGGAPTPY